MGDDPLPGRFPRPASALLDALRAGYGLAELRHDLIAGLIVSIVALPLSMALAIATGVPPQYGLYTAIVAGFVTALLGGSKVQVSGPTAAFVVILIPIVTQFGIGGLMLATAMAGCILFLFGLARFGRFIQFVPYPVTTGFTTGIALVIALGQFKDLLGLPIVLPEHFHERLYTILTSLGAIRWQDLLVSASTLLLLVSLPRLQPRLPAPLFAIGGVTLVVYLATTIWPGFEVQTIASRFSYEVDGTVVRGIPPWPPVFDLPWNLPGPDGQPIGLSFELIRALLPSALVIAILGALESLLSAVAADAMAGTRHDPDAELLAQGTANMVAPFFGGFAATGALARTATNLRAGACSPLAAMFHAVALLVAVLSIAPILGALPMAAMAAMLLMVAWRMSDLSHFVHVMGTAPRGDVIVLLTCFSLTVLFDMVIGVTAGLVMASALFMRRMAELSGTHLVAEGHQQLRGPVPRGVLVYRVEGPLFFGAAQKTVRVLQSIGNHGGAVVLDLQAVPAIDATGLVNLKSVLDKLVAARTVVILTGAQRGLALELHRGEIRADNVRIFLRGTLQDGVDLAAERVSAVVRSDPAN